MLKFGNWFSRSCLLLLTAAAPALSHAEQSFPPEDWQEQADPLASPDAMIGGSISVYAGDYPKSFNYYLDNNVLSSLVFNLMYPTILDINPLTKEFMPGIADRWTIGDDKKTFTFHLDERAEWSDGEPVTAEDILWTFDTIMDDKNLTGVHKVGLETFERPEVIDERTIRFTAKEVHWRNQLVLATFNVMPKHAFEDQDFNLVNFEFPVVGGPYKLGRVAEGRYLRMERRDDWWGFDRPSTEGTMNFETVELRFYPDQEQAFDAFKKGEIDLYQVYTSSRWVRETSGEAYDKNWIIKQQVYNYDPVGFQGFAMNLRRKPFDDLRVRKALAYLLDREKMNETIMYNQYFLQSSYYEDLYDRSKESPNPTFNFDKQKARELLKEAGWKVNPETGILEKNGRPFEITFLTRDASSDKFLVIYQQDLKDVGIRLKIERKDWAAWLKDMDDFNFDMTWAAWGASLWRDPEGMWASKEAERTSGNNVTGFKSDRVDKLIEQQKTIFDVEERDDIVREIDQIVTSQVPYVLLWNIDYTRLLYWNKFGMPDTILSKYGDGFSAITYWWYDDYAAADLKQAMKDGRALPGKDFKVKFDEWFEGEE
ncbi:MAG: microcin C transport system substrate-binding protein [Puniceicoccaceae bacterium 5H]|nr:MAG: microcin C transport system substrate-binding protein [Puniceicoccaceae bacterium 5H]